MGFALIASFILVPAFTIQPESENRFLERIRIQSLRPSAGEVTYVDPDGVERTLQEGEALVEEGGATLKDVTKATLVFERAVAGGDGRTGEALIVVRFDGSGKTRVREYRSVGSAPHPVPPPPDLD